MQVSDKKIVIVEREVPSGVEEEQKNQGLGGSHQISSEETSFRHFGQDIIFARAESVIDPSRAKVEPSSHDSKPREWYIQQMKKMQEEVLFILEQKKAIFKEDPDALERLQYIAQVADIKIKTYTSKIEQNPPEKFPEIWERFHKSEMLKLWGALNDEQKLRSIEMGKTFYDPPSSIQIYDRMEQACQKYYQADEAHDAEGCQQAWDHYLKACEDFWKILKKEKFVEGEFNPNHIHYPPLRPLSL